VDKTFELCLTGPVNHGVLFKVNCFAQNPSAAMRGGFLRWGAEHIVAYPTYIDWKTFEKIQAMLRDNRAEYQHIKSRGIPRDGAALPHGITYRGECGHKMTVRYKGGSQYVCNHLKIQRGAPECQNLRAASIDAQVAAAFLEAVTPAEFDALSKARKSHLQSERALRNAEERQIERLRYQAALAERQFNRADPDNRLVTGELERRWEAASRPRSAASGSTAHSSPTSTRRTCSSSSAPPTRTIRAFCGPTNPPTAPPTSSTRF